MHEHAETGVFGRSVADDVNDGNGNIVVPRLNDRGEATDLTLDPRR